AAEAPPAEDDAPDERRAREPVHADRAPRASASAPAFGADGRSTQISPLTDAPSAAEKLPGRREPVRTPDGRISTRVVAERFPRTAPPITIAEALMLASTCAPSPTMK